MHVNKKNLRLRVGECCAVVLKPHFVYCNVFVRMSIGRYFLQVAGCRLKFHYNWKTAGTKKKGKAIDLP